MWKSSKTILLIRCLLSVSSLCSSDALQFHCFPNITYSSSKLLFSANNSAPPGLIVSFTHRFHFSSKQRYQTDEDIGTSREMFRPNKKVAMTQLTDVQLVTIIYGLTLHSPFRLVSGMKVGQRTKAFFCPLDQLCYKDLVSHENYELLVQYCMW